MGDADAARKPRASKTTASTIALLASNVSPWNLCGNQPMSQHRVDGVGRPKFDFHTALNASTTDHTSKPHALTSDNAASSVFRRSFGTLDASCRSEIKSATLHFSQLRLPGLCGNQPVS